MKGSRPFPGRVWDEFFPEDLDAFVTVELGPEKAALVKASALYSILTDPDIAAYMRQAGRPVEPFLRALDGVESAAFGVRRGRNLFAAAGPPRGLDAAIEYALSGRGEEVFDYGYEEFCGKRGRRFAFLELSPGEKFVLGGSGRGEAELLVRSFLSPPERSLKDSELYGTAASLPAQAWVMRGFFDAGYIVNEAVKRAEFLGGRRVRAREFAGALGLDRMRCLAFSSTFDGALRHTQGAAARDVAVLSFEERAGLFDAARESDLSSLAETYVPKSAMVFAAVSADAASLLGAFKSGASEREAKRIDAGLAWLSVLLRVDVKTELLPALGNELAVFALPGLSAGREKNIGFILRLKDRDKVETALKRGLIAAKVLMLGLKVDEIECEGATIRYIERPGRTKLTPVVAITDDALLFGFAEAVVRRMLRARAEGEGATLASREELRPMLEKARSSAAAWCVSWDQLLGELFGLEGLRLDAEKAIFPRDAVVEKLFTGWGVASLEPSRVRIEARCPFGIPALLLLGALAPEAPVEEGEVF